MKTLPLHVFLLPSSNKNNKYIELLKNSITRVNSSIIFHNLPNDNLSGIWKILKSYDYKNSKNVVHIQWPTVLYGSRYILKSLFLICRNKIILLVLKIFYKFKMVWTVHNFYAHDYPHPLIDRLGTFLVRTLADEIIVQQEKTLSDWKTRYPSKSITHIPHGNYIGAYGPMVNRDHKLRMSLGFSESDIVLISFGAIAPYKCNEKIIKAFHTAKKKQPLLKLLIMGKGNSKYVESLISSVAGEQGIIIRNTFIPDEEMPKYLSIADYSIFYYDDSEMTSGGLILSLSYGIPVIIRNIPASEAVNRANGHVFGSDQELVEILQNLKKPLNPTLVRDTIETVLQYGWDDIADKLIGLYSRE